MFSIYRKSIGLLIMFVLAAAMPVFGHDTTWPGEKLERMYPAASSYEQRNLYISSPQRQRIEQELGEPLREEDLKPSVYFAVIKKNPEAKPKRAAVMIFIDAEGANDIIETGIVLNSTGMLEELMIFENREPPAISNPVFLSQFKNKKHTDPFQVGKDIQAPPGLEKTARAIASGARRGMLIINELFKRR